MPPLRLSPLSGDARIVARQLRRSRQALQLQGKRSDRRVCSPAFQGFTRLPPSSFPFASLRVLRAFALKPPLAPQPATRNPQPATRNPQRATHHLPLPPRRAFVSACPSPPPLSALLPRPAVR